MCVETIGDVYEYDAKDSYDIVMCQAVLQHLDTPKKFMRKMIEFAKVDAYIICIDSNREFECDGLYIDGMTRKEATDFCERNIEIASFFQDNPNAGYTFVKGTMISYGKK